MNSHMTNQSSFQPTTKEFNQSSQREKPVIPTGKELNPSRNQINYWEKERITMPLAKY